jgi:hypothetical protein
MKEMRCLLGGGIGGLTGEDIRVHHAEDDHFIVIDRGVETSARVLPRLHRVQWSHFVSPELR